jgi:hypothetical protein
VKVVTNGGEVIDLGTTETIPTIGITDYSRRVTDDFGVTTVVKRGFARRLSVRLAVPFDAADALQRRLAELRASPALWVADDRFDWLSARGFYKDFALDLATPPLSLCTLTVEGLAETETVADPGGDPAAGGQASTLQLLRPTVITAAQLTATNVPETDHPEWASSTSYPLGARVIKASTHRIYESVAAANVGNDPAGTSGKWLDLGPTNRWAMFDEALGTTTTAADIITVTLQAGIVDGVALLDVVGTSVRVQANAYDRTQAVSAGAVVFLDMPEGSAPVHVTVSGSGPVSVGTLIVGRRVALGVTEAAPTAGITDYSRKEIDDFGEVSVVERAWSKRMTVRALIRTDVLDVVANRIAAVRARPCLWIGQAGLDSLTVYGFFKEFSIEVGESVSKLSLSIEGLSKAAPVGGPLTGPRGEKGDKGDPGENAPLVLVQWSVDGVSGWHTDYQDGDKFQRQSVDGGASYGPAVRVVGEAATSGMDGVSPSIIFRRSATVPATPAQDTGNPPPGWFDGPPGGTDFLWQSTSRFRGGTQLQGWSTPVRISGRDGVDGVDGLPGVDGSDGVTWFTYFAYANSPDGTLDFTTGQPGTRAYVGFGTGTSPSEPQVASAYSWSAYKGSPFGITTRGSVVVAGDTVAKLPTGAAAWDSDAYSTVGFRGGCQVGFRAASTGSNFMAGLNGDPAGDVGFASLDHAWYCLADGTCRIFEAGQQVANAGTYFTDTDFQIVYKGQTVRYLKNGFEIRSVAAQPDKLFFFDSSFLFAGAKLTNLTFAAAGADGRDGTDGLDGSDGLNGAAGANGQTSYVHFAFANSPDGTVDFTTGAASGRYYIGTYTDFTPADSANPTSYVWSLFRGADGTNGIDGGDGKSVHIAYADSANGTVNFHLSDGAGRRYIGTYTDTTLADSTNPAAYTWSLIKGADGNDGSPGNDGQDGVTEAIAFIRASTQPATPISAANPPPGWSAADPSGVGLLWLTKASYRAGIQLTPWGTPQRVTGDQGAPGISAPQPVEFVGNGADLAPVLVQPGQTITAVCRLRAFASSAGEASLQVTAQPDGGGAVVIGSQTKSAGASEVVVLTATGTWTNTGGVERLAYVSAVLFGGANPTAQDGNSNYLRVT